MANLIPKRLYIGAATGGANVYTLTSNVGSYAIIRSINACNVTGAAQTVDVHIIPSGDAAADANKVLSSITIPADDVVTSDAVLVLEPGDSIYLNQANANVTLTISGVEYDAG
jgi:hypothetical protein